MIILNCQNGKKYEYKKYDDILENDISRDTVDYCTIPDCDYIKCNNKPNSKGIRRTNKRNKSNITPLERKLMRINVGSKRRVRNNHAQRLAKFKANAK